jgi:hypothetical protein
MRTGCWIVSILLILVAAGCAGGGNPVGLERVTEQGTSPQSQADAGGSIHRVWGIWEVMVSEDHQSVTVSPMRSVEMHLNGLWFIKKSSCANCLAISDVQTYGSNLVSLRVDVDHPLGYYPYYDDNYAVYPFDVRGIFMSAADYSFPVSGRSISWRSDRPRLLNADGYTSLFNPTEYSGNLPSKPWFDYLPGKNGTPAELTATLNPYLNFSGLYGPDPDPFISDNRTLWLNVPAGAFKFGYAIDASWFKTDHAISHEELPAYAESAQCREAYDITAIMGRGLGLSAGTWAPLLVNVYDHQGLETIASVTAECPPLFSGEMALDYHETQVGDHGPWSFGGVITNTLGAGYGEYPLLIRVRDTESDPNFGFVDAWHILTVSIREGWAVSLPATYPGQGLASDSEGRIYIPGSVVSDVDFDPGLGESMYYGSYPGDGYLTKFDPTGGFLWVRTFGELSDADTETAAVVDGDGNIYVVGSESNEETLVTLRKFDKYGQPLWKIAWGPDVEAHDLAVDSGDTLVAGLFTSTVDFDPGPGVVEYTAEGVSDAYLAKYDTNGALIWVRVWGGPEEPPIDYSGDQLAVGDSSGCVGLDSTGNIYVAGYFYGTTDFDPGPGVVERTPVGQTDAFLSKFTPDGTFMWVRSWGGPSYTGQNDTADDVATDTAGNVYVVGAFEGTVDFDPGSGTDIHYYNGTQDAFVSKFAPDGQYQWVRTWGGIGLDWAYGAAVVSDKLYITGTFQFAVDFDPGSGIDRHESLGEDDIFVCQYGLDGQFEWVRSWGGYSDDTISRPAPAPGGAIYFVGSFSDPADLDPGPGIDFRQPAEYSSDYFLMKLPSDGNW